MGSKPVYIITFSRSLTTQTNMNKNQICKKKLPENLHELKDEQKCDDDEEDDNDDEEDEEGPPENLREKIGEEG